MIEPIATVSRLFLCLVLWQLAAACESLDDPASETGEALSAAEIEQGLGASYVCKGLVANGAIKADTLSNTLYFEYAHRYRYNATAGQTVTFALQVDGPVGSSGGAWIGLTIGTAFPPSSYLAQARSTVSSRVRLKHTFAATGTYYLWVRQSVPLVGSYPYKLGVEAPLCAQLRGTDTKNKWSYIAVKSFAAGTGEEAFGWTVDPTWTVDGRAVSVGNCLSQKSTACGVSGPAIYYWEFPMGDGGPLHNLCEAWNYVFDVAGASSSWSVWWDYCSAHPEYC